MSKSVAPPLQGPLYFLSFASAAVVMTLGLAFVVSGPTTANLAFGIPVANSPLALDKHSGNAYIAIIGVRDLTLAFLSFVFVFLRDRRGAGVVQAGGVFATAGDAFVIQHYSKAPNFVMAAHVIACVPLAMLSFVMLQGTLKSQKLKQ